MRLSMMTQGVSVHARVCIALRHGTNNSAAPARPAIMRNSPVQSLKTTAETVGALMRVPREFVPTSASQCPKSPDRFRPLPDAPHSTPALPPPYPAGIPRTSSLVLLPHKCDDP